MYIVHAKITGVLYNSEITIYFSEVAMISKCFSIVSNSISVE